MNQAKEFVRAGNFEAAYKKINALLDTDPNNVPALLLVSALLTRDEKWSAAYHMCKRVIDLHPQEPSAYITLSACCHRLWQLEETEEVFSKGMALANGIPAAQKMLLVNRSAFLVDTGRWAEARQFAEAALQIDPKDQKAIENIAICDLAEGNWQTGWDGYDLMLQPKRNHRMGARLKRDYNGKPDWKGEKGKVVIYGEQGIGDIIAFASIVPDALEAADEVILDVEPRLVGLFSRSFDCEVTTNYKSEVDYACAIGQLGGLFRRNGEFPGRPYLTPCPTRSKMWQAEFKDRPVIGIAWTGGLPRTGDRFREWTAEDMEPLLELGMTFVSLEYQKGHKVDGIRDYPFATSRTIDYDDTAALVAQCDHVISVQTAAGHLSAALGVPTTMFVAKDYAQWRDTRPWCDSMKIVRQKGTWRDTIAEFAQTFKEDMECQQQIPLRRIS